MNTFTSPTGAEPGTERYFEEAIEHGYYGCDDAQYYAFKTAKPVKVVFKHEDEIDGVPVGPMGVIYDDDPQTGGRPYDPNRKVEWFTFAQAVTKAAELNVPLEQR